MLYYGNAMLKYIYTKYIICTFKYSLFMLFT